MGLLLLEIVEAVIIMPQITLAYSNIKLVKNKKV